VNEGFDIAALPAHLAQRLPVYARPVFVRISRELDATETFKQKKGELAREGFDPAAISDPLFMLDPKSGAYVALDAETHAQIVDGAIRLVVRCQVSSSSTKASSRPIVSRETVTSFRASVRSSSSVGCFGAIVDQRIAA